MKTLPDWMATLGLNLEAARKVIRLDPALSGLGTTFGATRVFSFEEIQRVREAIEARAAKRRVVPTQN